MTETSSTATVPPRLEPAAVRGVIFDLDGTLVDSYQAITASVNHARQAFNLEPFSAADVRGRVGHGLESLIAEVLSPDHVDEGVRLFRERYAQVYLDRTRALDGAADSLAALNRRGVRLAVASNKPARFSRPILDHLGLGAFITAVHGPDTVGATKPDPAMLRCCMKDLAVTPSETLYVGDMLLDVISAARAGVPVALVAGGSSTEPELRASGQIVVPRLTALCALLHENRGKIPPLAD